MNDPIKMLGSGRGGCLITQHTSSPKSHGKTEWKGNALVCTIRLQSRRQSEEREVSSGSETSPISGPKKHEAEIWEKDENRSNLGGAGWSIILRDEGSTREQTTYTKFPEKNAWLSRGQSQHCTEKMRTSKSEGKRANGCDVDHRRFNR